MRENWKNEKNVGVESYESRKAHSKKEQHRTEYISANTFSWSDMNYRAKIISSYANWIQEFINIGWNGYLLTFMFNHIPGSINAKVWQMQREINNVYNKLVTRVVRKPRSPAWADLLPRALIVPDLPVAKKTKQDIRDISINDSLHHHGIFVIPPIRRMAEPLDIHFQEQKPLYFRGSDKLRNIDVQPIHYTPEKIVEYAMKSLKRGRFSSNQILVLPRAISELESKYAASKDRHDYSNIKDERNV
jgi:hypothetical protein